ncbi:MAG: tRNA uridine-5-carboxymethylaminomethyl(34) synthesis enzyme MnmG [Puniceicoccales bacterium]|nr:tRNA uridine-5-carboxymethylaminomethyl(34) synthesis enzyme MnmG [Puniceicoccales bacterium]
MSGKSFDVIVCGAGHGGCEASIIAARRGAEVLLLTWNLDTIAQMSCNPAIGGQAKGQIVREIDALGGEMAINADKTAIQFRLLNGSKGPAVQSPRAQCDKKAYQFRMKSILERTKNLQVLQGEVGKLIVEKDEIRGVETNIGLNFEAKTVILTTGTFLRGLMHIGKQKISGGRLGDFAANTLSNSLKNCGIELGRMKTGTPPRILGSTIDFQKCEEQVGDRIGQKFAFYDSRPEEVSGEKYSEFFKPRSPGDTLDNRSCWITYTNGHTRDVIQENLHLSPLYSGEITGIGPRYCPSIEDKYVKFSGKNSHRLFLEPEGNDTDEWYINGLSTSLPIDVQMKILKTIPGLENVRIVRPAYAVEYDYAPPTQLYPSLESKIIENLFFAGQINGTSGYEEAAGQGIVAGINAVAKIRGEEPLLLGRHDAYIGVLIDDLVTKGTQEPYRMFTSRAEYRLLLNHGSAEHRLVSHAKKYHLLPERRIQAIEEEKVAVDHWCAIFNRNLSNGDSIGAQLLRNGGEISFPSEFLREKISIQRATKYRILYGGYLARELRQIEKMKELNFVKIPKAFSYDAVKSLRTESRQKVEKIKPTTLGQLSRISGISPADVNLIWIAIEGSRGTPSRAPARSQ